MARKSNLHYAGVRCVHLGTPGNSTALDRALACAREYASMHPGRTAELAGLRRDIEELAGYWDTSDAKPAFRIPRIVREAMGLPWSPDEEVRHD